ncbi:MAG: peptidase S41, partial [Cytophagales bacterium]
MKDNLKIQNSNWQIRLPIIVFLTLASGIFIGATMFNQQSKNDIQKNLRFFGEILTYIDRDYVDTVNTEHLVEDAVDKMLEKLDPHTVYIPPKDLQ